MKRIAELGASDVADLCARTAEALRGAASFEAAAETFVRLLVAEFETIALARVFGTVEFDALEPQERRFAEDAVTGVSLFPTTEVLTLFGSAGAQPQWNERRKSAGHLAIPLLNRRSIQEAPMIARLLDDLHFSLKTEPPDARGLATRAFANADAICYIPDAATTVDVLGRLVVPAADFVRESGIRTVVGVGGSYIVARMFVAILLFTTETISSETALLLKDLAGTFKIATTGVVRRRVLFGLGDEPANEAGSGGPL